MINIMGIEEIETGGYKVLSDGRFFNNSGKELFGSLNSHGYRQTIIGIVKNTRTTVKFHRMVAMKYVPNPNGKPCVNHINGIKDDNRAENLEWCTVAENNAHAFRLGLNPTAKLVLNLDTGIFYESAREASEYCGVNYSALRNKLSGYRFNNTNLIYC